MGILSALQYFAEILGGLWYIVTHIWDLLVRFLPPVIAAISAVMGRYDSAIPVPLKVIAVLCASAMLLRFVWNAVRGSGA